MTRTCGLDDCPAWARELWGLDERVMVCYLPWDCGAVVVYDGEKREVALSCRVWQGKVRKVGYDPVSKQVFVVWKGD